MGNLDTEYLEDADYKKMWDKLSDNMRWLSVEGVASINTALVAGYMKFIGQAVGDERTIANLEAKLKALGVS